MEQCWRAARADGWSTPQRGQAVGMAGRPGPGRLDGAAEVGRRDRAGGAVAGPPGRSGQVRQWARSWPAVRLAPQPHPQGWVMPGGLDVGVISFRYHHTPL